MKDYDDDDVDYDDDDDDDDDKTRSNGLNQRYLHKDFLYPPHTRAISIFH